MSVIDVRDNSGGGNNLLGMLGGLATLGGTLTGQGWLTGLGTGLETMNGMVNGTAKKEDIKNLGDMLREMVTRWKNPAEGNLAKANSKSVDKKGLEVLQSVRNDMQGVTPNIGPYETAATQAVRYLYGGY